jgi:hypothetical protein
MHHARPAQFCEVLKDGSVARLVNQHSLLITKLQGARVDDASRISNPQVAESYPFPA